MPVCVCWWSTEPKAIRFGTGILCTLKMFISELLFKNFNFLRINPDCGVFYAFFYIITSKRFVGNNFILFKSA